MAKAKTVLESIQTAAAKGELGSYRVRGVDVQMVKVETLNGNHSWLIDANTGACFSHQSSDVLTLIKNSLVTANHTNLQLEVVCVDRATKMMERFYKYYPLSTQVEAFEGRFEPTKLNAYLENRTSAATVEEMVGLPADSENTSARVFNVTGSVANTEKGSAFDRVVRGEYADVYFSSTSGAFRVQKLPNCSELYPMFPDADRGSISTSDVLDGLAVAPRVAPEDAFKVVLNSTPESMKR